LRGTPLSTIFPYTTLFRSLCLEIVCELAQRLILGLIHMTTLEARQCHFANAGRPGNDASANAISAQPLLNLLVCHKGHFLSPKRSEEHTSELQSRENLVCR